MTILNVFKQSVITVIYFITLKVFYVSLSISEQTFKDYLWLSTKERDTMFILFIVLLYST